MCGVLGGGVVVPCHFALGLPDLDADGHLGAGLKFRSPLAGHRGMCDHHPGEANNNYNPIVHSWSFVR